MDLNISVVRNFLQSFSEETQHLQNQIDMLNRFIWVLLVALVANIMAMLIKFYLDNGDNFDDKKYLEEYMPLKIKNLDLFIIDEKMNFKNIIL